MDRRVKVFWSWKKSVDILDVGDASCQYRVDGDPTIRELRVSVDRERQLAIIVLDGTAHRIPMEVLRILRGLDLED